MSEFKIPALPAAPGSAATQVELAAASAATGAPLPQDLAMILELMGPPSPGPPAVKQSAEEIIARIEAGRTVKDTSAVAANAAAADDEPKEGEEVAQAGKATEETDSDSSDSSSESDSSSSSSVSSASRSVAGAGPSAAIVASHNRNAKAVNRLTREGSLADSEPDLDPDFFKSPNELPAPTTAPALPFERISEGQGSKELGQIKSVVGKLVIIEHRTSGLGRGQGSDDILGEGTVVCWKDGRVLGIVNDTFGPLTAPMYTLILPDPFAPPTAPAEDDAPLPTAATELSNAARTEDAEPSDGTPGETLADPSPVAVADTPSEAATVIDGAVSDVAAGPGASPAKDDDLEVEALVQADAAAPSPAATLESSVPTSPLPTSSDLPVSPPAPHRSLPPTFPKAGLVGLTVYYPVQLSNRVPVAQLKRQRWTDASNKFDEECGEEEMDWSDDEAEAAAKRRKKLSRGSKAGSVRGGSPTPSMGSQWGGSHFDANSDDEGTVLNYTTAAETSGVASLPKRPMPVAYDDLDASEYRGEGSSGAASGVGRGSKKRERGGAVRGKGKERAADSPSSRGGFESSRGSSRGARGGSRGGFDAGRGIARPRGRGGAMGSPHTPHLTYELQQQQQQQQGSAPAPTIQPPARPLSPTSMAIARATGEYPHGAQPQPSGPAQGPPPGMQYPVRPYFPQAGFPYPSPYGQPMAPYSQMPPPGQQQSQQHQPQQHAFGGPVPGAHMPYGQPPFGYAGIYGVPQGQPQQNPALQQALQQQQAEHNKQLLEMQRQIALLSRKQASGSGPTPEGSASGSSAGQ